MELAIYFRYSRWYWLYTCRWIYCYSCSFWFSGLLCSKQFRVESGFFGLRADFVFSLVVVNNIDEAKIAQAYSSGYSSSPLRLRLLYPFHCLPKRWSFEDLFLRCRSGRRDIYNLTANKKPFCFVFEIKLEKIDKYGTIL